MLIHAPSEDLLLQAPCILGAEEVVNSRASVETFTIVNVPNTERASSPTISVALITVGGWRGVAVSETRRPYRENRHVRLHDRGDFT